MLSLNKDPIQMKRGVDKEGSSTKAASILLAGILSAALAILPSGPYAFAETPGMAGTQGQASEEVQSARSASYEKASNETLAINLGKLESDGGNIYYWPNLAINASDPDRLIYSVTVQFTSAIDDSDEINAVESGDFTILNANKHGNKTINNGNGSTADEWQEYLRKNLTVCLTDADTAANIRITLNCSLTDRTVEYFSGTGHYYELVSPGGAITWASALNEASQRQYMGMQGYLATITSAGENDIATSLIRANCWIGSTCEAEYIKEWYPDASTRDMIYVWVTGPEAGTRIPLVNGGDVYSNWSGGQPDFWGGIEHYMHIYGSGGTWNDYANDNPTVFNYLVEYGGMPDDELGSVSDDYVTVDIALDPSGRTLSTSLKSNRLEIGDSLLITENVNGETIPFDNVTRTFYVEDASQPDGWRKLDDSELGANGAPMHAGNYKVESNATYVDDEGNVQQYIPGSAKFTIVPKTIDLTDRPLAAKAYDGTGAFDLSGIDISGRIPEGLDIELGSESVSATGVDASDVGDKTVVLEGASLAGSDAGDYRLKVRLQILPRQLTINSETNISKGYVGTALTTKDGEELAVKTNLSIRDADAGADVEWLENELASCDGVANGNGMQGSILGEETLVVRSGEKVLDPENPEKGTYKVEVHYANVNPVDGDGMPIEPSGPLNVTKIDDWTYEIGNYVLTIKPTTITITTRNAGGTTAPGDGDADDPSTGTTFAPIDATTDVRLDPSSTGTVRGDPYFEYESGKPVNVLNAIQVRPEGGSDWSDWMGGSGSTNPDDGSGPGTSNPGDPTNPDDPTSPGNPDDPSVPSNPDGSDGPNDPTNPDGSGNGTGTNPGGTTPQLPDGVKVVVTDESGNQVDPTNVKDPGTYEVTVSVKDPDTGEFVVIDTIKFYVVDTSITDTDLIYRDVPKDHWGHGYIFDIGPSVINGAFNPSDVALGYMAGYAGTKDFGPHNGIIRGDAAIVIWRMAGCPDVDQAKASSGADGNAAYLTGFADCDANPTMYWNEAIAWCASNGIVTGYGDTGLYLPQNQITREEFASIIARYAAFKGKDVSSATADLSQYPDIDDVSDWAAPNMHYVVSSGIMTGKGTDEGTADGTHGILDPQAHVTRAEVAKMTYMEQPYRLLP